MDLVEAARSVLPRPPADILPVRPSHSVNKIYVHCQHILPPRIIYHHLVVQMSCNYFFSWHLDIISLSSRCSSFSYTQPVKAPLHCSISSATCNATLKNVFVAVAEVRCYTVQRTWATCNDLCRESLAKLATGAPGSVVGRIDKEINARSGKIALQVAGGVLHCGSCKLLRLLRKVELDSTSCKVARNKKRCVPSCRGTLLHRAILHQLATQRCCVASCCKNCTV